MTRLTLRKHLPTFGLLLVAIIWGAGFIWTQIALDSGFSAGLILFCRFAVAALVLLLVGRKHIFPLRKQDLIYGASTGFLLFLGFYVQTTGLRFTTPSNNGFFTAANVIMVPFITWALHHRRPPAKLWLCCVTALVGFFVLAYRPSAGFPVNAGDLLTLLSAFFFACHIAGLEVVSREADPLRLTFLQMATAGILSLCGFLLFERDALGSADLSRGGFAVLFLGLFSTCLCFFLQTWGQSKMSSGKATIIMAGESLWCMIFSVIVGYEALTARMAAGGILIVGATVLLEADFLPAQKAASSSCEI